MIGDILGCEDDDEIILFNLMGMVIEDILSVYFIY